MSSVVKAISGHSEGYERVHTQAVDQLWKTYPACNPSALNQLKLLNMTVTCVDAPRAIVVNKKARNFRR